MDVTTNNAIYNAWMRKSLLTRIYRNFRWRNPNFLRSFKEWRIRKFSKGIKRIDLLVEHNKLEKKEKKDIGFKDLKKEVPNYFGYLMKSNIKTK